MYNNYPTEKNNLKPLPMGVDKSSEILQQKMNNLFHGFEFIPAYIEELLVLTNEECTYHVQNLELTLNKLKEKGLKYNIENYFLKKTKI